MASTGNSQWSNAQRVAQKTRSGLEDDLVEQLEAAGVTYGYETTKLKYTKKPSTYTPDFTLANGIIVEAKGYWLGSDRTKHILIREQYPHLDIRMVFSNSKTKLSKRSKTTYGDWCAKRGIIYADKLIPEAWLTEEPKGD